MTTAPTVQSGTRRFTIVAVTTGILAVVLALPLAYYVAYSVGMIGMVVAVLEPVSPLRRGLLVKAGAALTVIALALSITANAAWALIFLTAS
jgi:hypothetical protein